MRLKKAVAGVTDAKLHNRLTQKWIKRIAAGQGSDSDEEEDDGKWLPQKAVGRRRHTLVLDP